MARMLTATIVALFGMAAAQNTTAVSTDSSLQPTATSTITSAPSTTMSTVTSTTSSTIHIVTSMFYPFNNSAPLEASIIGVSADVSTLVAHCASDTSNSTTSADCGFPEPITFTAGPSTFAYNPTGIYQRWGQWNCSVLFTTNIICNIRLGAYPSITTTGTGYLTITTPASTSVSGLLQGTGKLRNVTITASGTAPPAATTTSQTGAASKASLEVTKSLLVLGSILIGTMFL